SAEDTRPRQGRRHDRQNDSSCLHVSLPFQMARLCRTVVRIVRLSCPAVASGFSRTRRRPMHWSDLLVPGEPLVAKIIRPIIIYGFLVIGLRLGGKRELAQLSPFDIIVLLTLSNTVQNAIIGNDNSITGGMIGASTLLAANALVVRFLYR